MAPDCQGFFTTTNDLIDLDRAVILDVEATAPLRPAQITAAERVQQRFGLYPERLAADAGYGTPAMLGWLVAEAVIEPRIPVLDKSGRKNSV